MSKRSTCWHSVRDLVATHAPKSKSWTAEEVARSFKGSRRADVASVLVALSSLGLLIAFDAGDGTRWSAP